jgi:hypothetical protein
MIHRVTQYDGTVADLAQEVGQALTSIHKIISGMRNIDNLHPLITRSEQELQTIENISRRLQS